MSQTRISSDARPPIPHEAAAQICREAFRSRRAVAGYPPNGSGRSDWLQDAMLADAQNGMGELALEEKYKDEMDEEIANGA